MSRKHFSWLLALTLVVGAVILLMPARTGHESGFEVRPLIAGMDSWVNDVSRVRIVKAGNQTVATLSRGDRGWVVEEAESYAADWAKLKALLAALAQARIIELKTTNPDYFDRLGLKDVTDDSSTAMMIEVGEGEHQAAVLVGHTAQNRDGQYVRLPNDNQALLVDKTMQVATETRDWLHRDIVDVPESEVVEVNITHPDGEQVSVRKTSAEDQDFTLQDLPEGREIQSSWSVNALGGSLSGLVLDEVTADRNIDWSQATHLRLLTADGIEYGADVAESGEKTWIRLEASLHPPRDEAVASDEKGREPEQGTEPAQAKAPASGEAEAEGSAMAEPAADGAGKKESAEKERTERVASINSRVNGWAYAIPQFKAQVMQKRLEDLLKPPEAEKEK